MFDTSSTTLLVLVILGLIVAAGAVTALLAWAIAAVFAVRTRRLKRSNVQPEIVYSGFLFDLAMPKDREYDEAPDAA